MPSKKKRVVVSQLKGIKLYNFLLKELSEQNDKSKTKQKLSLAAKRKIVSEQLYPKFKSATKLNLQDVRKDLRGIVRGLAPKEICNPLYLSEAYLSFIEYYEIDNHIKTVLPDCLDVRVNAGSLGKTKIFNTKNYTYYSSGVRKIIENIRKELDENKSGMADFSGVVKVKPKRPNDGNGDNYYVEFVLSINDVPEADETPADFDLPKRAEKKVEKVRDILAERFGVLQKEKRKRKRIAKKEREKKELEKPQVQRKKIATEIRNSLNALRRLLKAKLITKEEFEIQKESLMKLKKRK
jgi:hypothetical protein